MVTSLSSMMSLTFKPCATARRAASASLPSYCAVVVEPRENVHGEAGRNCAKRKRTCWEPSDPSMNTVFSLLAKAMPLTNGQTWPRRPEENFTPGVRPSSGWPGSFEFAAR